MLIADFQCGLLAITHREQGASRQDTPPGGNVPVRRKLLRPVPRPRLFAQRGGTICQTIVLPAPVGTLAVEKSEACLAAVQALAGRFEHLHAVWIGGEPMQAPGRWLSSPGTLARLGIDGEKVEGREFIALMEGRHPRSGEWLRRVGADGSRGGGIDLTFSAPYSVSITWALGDQDQREQVEAAHAAAVYRSPASVQ